MNDYLSSASVVLHVVGETECLLTEDSGKFLLLLDLLFIEDSAELVEGILCIMAQRRDVLRRILPDVDGSCDNGDFVLLLALPLTGGEVLNQDALYDIFIGGKIGMREDGRVEIEGHDVRR